MLRIWTTRPCRITESQRFRQARSGLEIPLALAADPLSSSGAYGILAALRFFMLLPMALKA